MIVFKYKPIQTLNSIMISSSSSGDSPAHSRSDRNYSGLKHSNELRESTKEAVRYELLAMQRTALERLHF